ncbi:MAG: thiamine-phosphate diphosphorylase [Acidobacteriales bacterium]|nr:thiamine-phosphate diphosphorylase [Terriglobales bacterium]
MESKIKLPVLYAIIDKGCLPQSVSVVEFAGELIRGGVTLLQYRNKMGNAREMLSDLRELKRVISKGGSAVRLLVNDRADLCVAASADGVHLGQDDLSVEGARVLCKSPMIVGISTHNLKQVEAADGTSADYIAIGPIFQTSSKANPDPVVGLDGLKAVRKLTKKQLVAIGGITRGNCQQVIKAGADSVAVISDLLREPEKSAQEFVQLLTETGTRNIRLGQ